MSRSAFAHCAALIFAVASHAPARGDDVAADFRTAKSKIIEQLRGKRENRLAAIARLEEFPTPEAARLLLTQGLGSAEEDVRRAAFDVLTKFTANSEVCAFLKTTVSRAWKQGKPQPETYAGIALLLMSELPEVSAEAVGLIKETSERGETGRIQLITLTDELAKCRGDAPCRALLLLLDLPLTGKDFALRRAIEQALARVRTKPAVTALIKLLATVRGEVRNDIVAYLSDLTGQQFGPAATAWDKWWSENEPTFEFPPEQKRLSFTNPEFKAGQQPPAGASYYGVPISAARLIFIMDTSGSMSGPRIVAAKRELVRAIESLPENVEFNIVVFNSRASSWQNKLVPASAENKQLASYFVAGQVLGSRTASYDALEAALRFDAEVIFFLTDGAPVGGKITSPPDIIRTITGMNQFRRMTIHSLGIGVFPPPNVFDTFLSTLAEQNYGIYHRVDQ
jgi:hypothetical protein